MKKVIIVDDHPVIRFAVKMLLEKHGLEVVAEMDNGVDALAKVRELEPDLVLLDIGLPKIDGFQVIERLRSMAIPLKILVLTSQATRTLPSAASRPAQMVLSLKLTILLN